MINNIPKSLQLITHSVLDYAGLFPPASLNLPNAFSNYINYLDHDFNFILSKFICPAAKFPELSELINMEAKGKSGLRISVLGKEGIDVEEFRKNLANDLTLWSEFLKAINGKAATNFLEVKLPAEITSESPKEIASLLNHVSGEIKKSVSNPVFIFYEGTYDSDSAKGIKALIDGIERHNETAFDSGFKLRTGGITPESVPSPELIVYSLRHCLDRKVPMKFTAGLHHAFKNYDKQVGSNMHGFLNVFCAGIIVLRHNISDSGLEEILNDEDSKNFIFTDEYFEWKGWQIGNNEIVLARENLVTTFGSCSFDEPAVDIELIAQNLKK